MLRGSQPEQRLQNSCVPVINNIGTWGESKPSSYFVKFTFNYITNAMKRRRKREIGERLIKMTNIENKCRLALEAIIDYQHRIGKCPVLNHEFKKYALAIANEAIGPENNELPVGYKDRVLSAWDSAR